jgi:hypothetical protein
MSEPHDTDRDRTIKISLTTRQALEIRQALHERVESLEQEVPSNPGFWSPKLVEAIDALGSVRRGLATGGRLRGSR